VTSRFILEEKLKQQRFLTTSLGYEQMLGANSQFELSFTQRKGRFGLPMTKLPQLAPKAFSAE
jgi:hypothetical protein